METYRRKIQRGLDTSEPSELRNATRDALHALDTIQTKLQNHKAEEAKNFSPFHNVTITKFKTSKSYEATKVHTWPHTIVVRKLEVVFEDFGPQIPADQIQGKRFREGGEDLHRISELVEGVGTEWGQCGDIGAYHPLKWKKIST